MRASYRPSRESFIPKDLPVRVRLYDDIPAMIAMWDSAKHGRPIAIGFRGKANKPAFYFNFRNQERRDEYIREWLDGQRASKASKAAYRVERSKPHSLKVGQVLYSSWGYDQTNIDYYEVIRVVGPHTVEIREIGCVGVAEQGGPSELVSPKVGNYIGDSMIKRASADNSVRIASYASAYPWNGEAKSRTGYGWGH